MTIQDIVSEITSLAEEGVNYQALGKLVNSMNFDASDLEQYIPEQLTQESYSRHILSMSPIEIAILNWPPGVESAVHAHEGFFGYVTVLEGNGLDQTYAHEGDELNEGMRSFVSKGGIITEPDGIIHKISNPSTSDRLVTLHIYYPALHDFEGMKIFDLESGNIGELGKDAKTASWSEPKEAFNEVQEKAFQFYSYEEQFPDATHRVVQVSPKPKNSRISELVAEYYDEQANSYDENDASQKSRSKYTAKIDELIGLDLKENLPNAKAVLSVACGTGTRTIQQREVSKLQYDVVGVDVSEKMCKIATEAGIKMHNAAWLEADLEGQEFDAATFLYAFGHIGTEYARLRTLQKIAKSLKQDGVLYLDAFSIEDTDEWGPWWVQQFYENNLYTSGMDHGDLFYQKVGNNGIAYLHYFDESQLRDLLRASGFSVEWVKYIGYTGNSGEIVKSAREGFFFVKATKI